MTTEDGEMLLTVFLKHQQDKNLGEINAKLDDTGFWKEFPPKGVEVVGWYVMMGIGQVAILIQFSSVCPQEYCCCRPVCRP